MGHRKIPFGQLGGGEKARFERRRIKELEQQIRYYEDLAAKTPVGEDGVSPYQPTLAQLYREVSDLEFALACPATAS